MHELSIAMSLLEVAEEEAEKRGNAPAQENTGEPQFSVGSPRNPDK